MSKLTNFKIIKNLVLVLILSFIIISPFFCYAIDNLNNAFTNTGPLGKAAGTTGAGYDTENTSEESTNKMISLVITTVLSFLGVIFLVLAIYAGFTWMTARGNEEKVADARSTLTNAVIGLVVVLAAYAISYYVIQVLGKVALEG
jgi:cytochrome bd-type quinol oxidase subunit 2